MGKLEAELDVSDALAEILLLVLEMGGTTEPQSTEMASTRLAVVPSPALLSINFNCAVVLEAWNIKVDATQSKLTETGTVIYVWLSMEAEAMISTAR